MPLGLDVYSSGLVAADRLPHELVARMTAAVVAALERQRHEPELGLPEVVARAPRVVPDDAREGWRLVEPRIFTGEAPGSMSPDRWALTVAYLSRAHGLAPVPAERMFRASGVGDFVRPSSPASDEEQSRRLQPAKLAGPPRGSWTSVIARGMTSGISASRRLEPGGAPDCRR